MNTPMYNLAVILFLVSLFNDQKVVPLNTELSLNGTSCPSNVTLRELKLGIIVAVARLSEGLSVTVTCADIPFPVTFMERRVMPFLSVSIFNPVGVPSTVILPTPLGPPPDWNGEILHGRSPVMQGNEVGGRIYISMFTML